MAYNYVNDANESAYREGYSVGFDNASTTRIMYDNAIIIVGNHTLNDSEKSELYIKGTKEIIDNGTTYRVNLQYV